MSEESEFSALVRVLEVSEMIELTESTRKDKLV